MRVNLSAKNRHSVNEYLYPGPKGGVTGLDNDGGERSLRDKCHKPWEPDTALRRTLLLVQLSSS